MKKSLVLFAAALFGFGCISCDDGQSVKDFCDQVVQCAPNLFTSSAACQSTINAAMNAAPDCSDYISDYYVCLGNVECKAAGWENKACVTTAVDQCKADHNYQ